MPSRWRRRRRPPASTAAWSTPASARNTQTEPLRPEQLQVAIIGAGATGTELAAELHKTTRQLVAYGLDRIDPDKDIKIHLIEAAPRILPALPERLAEAAAKLLEGLEVRVHTGAPVAEVLANGVRARRRHAHPGRAGGVGGRREGAGRPRTTSPGWRPTGSTSWWCGRRCRPRATTTSSPSATAPPVRGRATTGPVPPRAQAAHQQASHLAKQLPRRLAGEPLASGATAISARWSRSATTPRSAA